MPTAVANQVLTRIKKYNAVEDDAESGDEMEKDKGTHHFAAFIFH